MKTVTIGSLMLIFTMISCASNEEQGAKEQTAGIPPPTALVAQAEADDAQEGQMLSTPTAENIIAALKESGIHIYNINLPKIDLEKYELVLYRDTYLNGVKSATHPAYPKYSSLKATSYTNAKNRHQVVLTLIDKNDSLFAENWQLPTGSRTTTTSRKDKQHFLDYNVTPFKSQPIKPGKKIPVLLYGSSWKDEKRGVMRYCMERELAPDFSSEAFRNMPGYYVYSIELQAIK